jgi:hypothetical protein
MATVNTFGVKGLTSRIRNPARGRKRARIKDVLTSRKRN